VNRLIEPIQAAQKTLDAMDPVKLEKFKKTMKGLSFEEIFVFQEKKSQAQAMQIITLEESLTIYNALCDWEGTDLATRSVVYLAMGQIIPKLMKLRKSP
jgi:hypothetical protein